MPATQPRAPRAPYWQRLWRRPVFKRGFYEVLGLLLWRQPGLQMLNCGYAEKDFTLPTPPSDLVAERLGCQLYHRLVRDVALRDRDVVEIGCGRSGGARFLAHTTQPRSYLATDASRLLILGNRRRSTPGLRFAAAAATALPVAAASCDVLLGVEAIHPLPDKGALLAEASRVLRPGGVLLLADFFYTRETSPHSVAGFHALIRAAAWRLVSEEDWTQQAVAALAEDSPRRLATINALPRLLRRPALSFAGTTESPLYRQLGNGQARYLFFKLQKAG